MSSSSLLRKSCRQQRLGWHKSFSAQRCHQHSQFWKAYRTIELFELEGNFRGHLVPFPAVGGGARGSIGARSPPSLTLGVCRAEAPTTSLFYLGRRNLSGHLLWFCLLLENHRMPWVEGVHNDHLVSAPCYVRGRQPPDQAAQIHIQPGKRKRNWLSIARSSSINQKNIFCF